MGKLEMEFLAKCKATGAEVTIFLRHGYQFKAVIEDFDDGALVVLVGNEHHLVFRQNISTIVTTLPFCP